MARSCKILADYDAARLSIERSEPILPCASETARKNEQANRPWVPPRQRDYELSTICAFSQSVPGKNRPRGTVSRVIRVTIKQS